jgi:glycosyltransferase involved in cell wall biosynthesis
LSATNEGAAGVTSRLVVDHFGNIANNAYFNYRILESSMQVENSKIVEPGTYAMSAPAWDALDFTYDRKDFVEAPSWGGIPRATAVNDAFMLRLNQRKSLLRFMQASRPRRTLLRLLARSRTVRRVYRFARNSPANVLRSADVTIQARGASALEIGAGEPAADITIFYGPGALMHPTRESRAIVALEHGTLRWIRYGADSDVTSRVAYSNWLKTADHLWVTNLDDATLDLADELMVGRWSALPHPYFLDPHSPYPANDEVRLNLLRVTSSEFLIFLPSSINWMPDHDKGSRLAIEAFIEMRKSGLSIGVIAVRWGRQVREAQELLHAAKIGRHVHWIDPLPRIPLQRLMACVDTVWDQFHYGAFGGVTMKAMEQGVPVITHAVDRRGADLMGGSPPLIAVKSGDELVQESTHLYECTSTGGWISVKEQKGDPLREWMQTRHHHRLTEMLQMRRYRELLAPESTRPQARPDAWGQALGLREWSPQRDAELLAATGIGAPSRQEKGIFEASADDINIQTVCGDWVDPYGK